MLLRIQKDESLRSYREIYTVPDEFLNPGNLEMVIQLTSSQKILAKTVLAVHQLRNEPCGMAPEKYVAEIDRMLKLRYSAGAIRISD